MATDVAAIKAALDPLLGGNVARDVARSGRQAKPVPYADVSDDVSRVPLVRGDGLTMAWRKLVQVDLFQSIDGEDDTLTNRVVQALDGLRCASGRANVDSVQRFVEDDRKLVHHAVTIAVGSRRTTD